MPLRGARSLTVPTRWSLGEPVAGKLARRVRAGGRWKRTCTTGTSPAAYRCDAGALLVDQLFPKDVCVPAVLSEFAQHVEVHPAQRERAAPVAVENVVQPEG